MRTAHRGPTLIALRARREALQIAREIAYPEITIAPAEPTRVLPVFETEGAPIGQWRARIFWGLCWVAAALVLAAEVLYLLRSLDVVAWP